MTDWCESTTLRGLALVAAMLAGIACHSGSSGGTTTTVPKDTAPSDATVLDAGTQDAVAGDAALAEAGAGPPCYDIDAAVPADVIITVDGDSSGRTFDYIGGLSGGGGTSRLLYDYAPDKQSEILDYLFKPNFGASLQLLKVEIGADVDSTNGAEASHERSATDQNYHRGYEWWLMQEAKARNPNIKLYGLEWGAPGWLGGLDSSQNIQYIIDWIKNAQSEYGLTIDFIGGWNEGGFSTDWLIALKNALIVNGLSTKLVAADDYMDWGIEPYMFVYPEVNAAVDILGSHYICGHLSDGSTCNTGRYLLGAIALNKPLWASEEGSQPYDTGAFPMAREYNRHYIQAKVTASINWSLVASWYTNLPYRGVDGLLLANEPWSGHYVVEREIWTTAQTTQFVQPGWQYLDTGCAMASGIGSFVTLKSPNGKDWSVIVETTNASVPVVLRVVVTGDLSLAKAHLWSTDLGSTDASSWFVQQNDLDPSGCAYSFTVQPNHVYSLTTTSGQSKGTTSPPASAPLGIPFSDDFESYAVGVMPNIPKYFSTVEGAFEVENCLGGHAGKCLQQEITTLPTKWGSAAITNPITVVGDPSWSDYQVTVDVLLQHSGAAELVGRLSRQDQDGGGALGYHFQVSDSGVWKLCSQNATMQNTPLASGTVSFPLGTWLTLALSFSGSTISAFANGTQLASVTDTTYPSGNVALSSSQWNDAQFDNFAVSAP